MLTKVGQLKSFTEKQIMNEPMVFSADPLFAWKNGGSITRMFLESLSLPTNRNVVIDTRLHMLKKGWFPSIPGFHLDAIPRGEDGQPNLLHPAIKDIEHYLCIVDYNTGSLTEFLREQPTNLPITVDKGNLWGEHSRLIKESNPNTFKIDNCGIYKFDAMEYHNTTPATGSGWRLFIRASVNTLTHGPFNEVRKQVQTYLPFEDLGW